MRMAALEHIQRGYKLTSLGLQSMWDHLSGGSALFVLILHFYGPGSVLYFDNTAVAEVLQGAGASAEAQLLSTTTTVIADMIHSGKVQQGIATSSDASPSSAWTKGYDKAGMGLTPIRVEPLMVYRHPHTAQQKLHNLVYIFKLWNAIGVNLQWTRLTDWMNNRLTGLFAADMGGLQSVGCRMKSCIEISQSKPIRKPQQIKARPYD